MLHPPPHHHHHHHPLFFFFFFFSSFPQLLLQDLLPSLIYNIEHECGLGTALPRALPRSKPFPAGVCFPLVCFCFLFAVGLGFFLFPLFLFCCFPPTFFVVFAAAVRLRRGGRLLKGLFASRTRGKQTKRFFFPFPSGEGLILSFLRVLFTGVSSQRDRTGTAPARSLRLSLRVYGGGGEASSQASFLILSPSSAWTFGTSALLSLSLPSLCPPCQEPAQPFPLATQPVRSQAPGQKQEGLGCSPSIPPPAWENKGLKQGCSSQPCLPLPWLAAEPPPEPPGEA